MEITFLIVVIGIIRAIVSAYGERNPVIETVFTREALCFSCVFAHIARGFRERDEIIACTYGGSVRPLKFKVCDCTLYCCRNADSNLVRVIGFADTANSDDYVEVAARTDN